MNKPTIPQMLRDAQTHALTSTPKTVSELEAEWLKAMLAHTAAVDAAYDPMRAVEAASKARDLAFEAWHRARRFQDLTA